MAHFQEQTHEILSKFFEVIQERVGTAVIVSNTLMSTCFEQLKRNIGQNFKSAATHLQELVTDQDLAAIAEQLLKTEDRVAIHSLLSVIVIAVYTETLGRSQSLSPKWQ